MKMHLHSQIMKLPIRFIGIGEAIEDLREFQADAFVCFLLNHETENA